MGAFLDRPRTEKSNDEGEANGLRYAVASMQGWRVDMEDAHVIACPMAQEAPFNKWSFFAVFDGHAGSRAAERSAENLLSCILETAELNEIKNGWNEPSRPLDVDALRLLEEGIKAGFLLLDARLHDNSDGEEKERSGTTVISAIITPSHVVLANLGVFHISSFHTLAVTT
ncbi:hypothetical protein AB6A40_010960 [Gnathostoma spinigerum]|uniref:PPM-type phosphatase domain-containing protein n=1 Tax=Gnathostoma spinigerum TaxID=75299 RepID=A0ABD6F254_9BILA